MNITVYELLGLIKVHKAPKKIMIRGFEFIFGCETTIENYYVLEETKERWLDAIDIRLYDEVEIIEEDKKIEKINILVDDTNMEYVANNKGKKLSYSEADLLFANKINELIEEIEKLKGKSE